MRYTALVLMSAGALAACSPSAPSGSAGGGAFPDLTQASYRAEATVQNPAGGTMPVVMIRSGNKLRMELTTSEGQMAVINNGETGEHFVLMTSGGRTTAMHMSSVNYENPAEQWNAEFASTATRTGSCAVAGQSGSEWTRDVSGQPHTTCVTDDGIILRAAEGDRTTWETTSVQRGPQSADLFVMPPGVQAIDMSAIAGAAVSAAQTGHLTPELCERMRNGGAPADVLSRAGCS